MSDTQPERLNWRVNDFCMAFGIGRTKFYQLVNEGRIKTVKLGSRTLIPADQVASLQADLAAGID